MNRNDTITFLENNKEVSATIVCCHHRIVNGVVMPYYYVQKNKKDNWIGLFEEQILSVKRK